LNSGIDLLSLFIVNVFNNQDLIFIIMKCKVFLSGLFILIFLNSSVLATKHFVMNGDDSGIYSLRNKIELANPGDTIYFAPGVDRITLTSSELLIQKSLYIKGNINKTVIQRSSDDGTPSFRIFHFINSGEVHLVNLDIYNGLAPLAAGYYPQHGGGICINDTNSHIYIKNCLVHYNSAASGIDNFMGPSGYAGGCGGGIYNAGFLHIQNSKICNNKGGSGGSHSLPKNDAPFDCFSYSGGSGGAIFSTHELVMLDCYLYDNMAGTGGICYDFYGPNPSNGGHGGAVYVSSGNAIISNCLIYNNKSGYAYNSGTGTNLPIYCANTGSGAGILNNSNLFIVNSTIIDNSVPFSAYNYYGDIHYCNGRGPGIYGTAISTTLIRNCILFRNSFLQETQHFNDIFAIDSLTMQLQNSLAGVINWHDTSTNNFINVNPSFIDSSDYHLAFNSPCINAGDPDTTGLPMYDLEGNFRVIENRVDMGAYEFQGFSTDGSAYVPENILIFPNPFHDRFTIFIPENLRSEVTHVAVHTLTGRIVFKTPFNNRNADQEIELPSSLPKGIYLLVIRNTKACTIQKIIKL